MAKPLYLLCALAVGATFPCISLAEPTVVASSQTAGPNQTQDTRPSIKAADDRTPLPMTLDDLGEVSAGTGADNNVVSRQQLTAVNSGNSVNAASVTTGTISLEGSALSGYNGVGNFVMNTGNNNNLQGSLSVNISGVAGK